MRRYLLALACVATSGWAFWAPNHENINLQIVREGRPWATDFTRSGQPVGTIEEYVSRVLYVSMTSPPSANILVEPTEGEQDQHPCEKPDPDAVRGVPFNDAKTFGVIGDDKPTDAARKRFSLWCWVVKGGLWEDGFNGMDEGAKWGGRRAVNHFHDPLSTNGGGYTGLLDENTNEAVPYQNLLRRGISVTEWVMNGRSGSALFGRNEWGYPTIGVGLQKAFSEKELKLRERGMAAAFRSMGQMMHLIGDNTVPDHARDLAHPGDGFEEYLRDDPAGRELFNHTPYASWVTFPVRTLATGGLRAFWDRDVYTSGPEITTSGVTPGLCEFTNANFLAWSHLKRGPVDLDFSTVPKEPGEGFVRRPRLGFTQTAIPFPYPRTDNLVDYPWPQLGPLSANVYPSAPRTLPLPALALFDAAWSDGFSGPNVLGPKAWKDYAGPLMARAHGYGQSVLSLALQPARAEVTPVFSDADFLRLELRLWNLWPASSPHALTWSIDSVELVAIRPEGVVVPNGAEVSIKTTLSRNVAPGDVLQTTAAVTFAQYATLARSSHTALLVTAHIPNAEKTPLLFAVPIPNGYPLVKQQQTIDQTSLFTAPGESCCGNVCEKCGAQQAFRNPTSQHLTGEIEVIPTQRDVFMKKATPEVRAAMKRDARVAAVQLLAWPQPGATFASPTRLPPTGTTTLSLGNTTLQRVNAGFWQRGKDTTDGEEGPMTFTVDLAPTDFYVLTGGPLVDGARATGTVYLAVWMTSGALYLQRLVFWPMGPNRSAAQVFGAAMTCGLSNAPKLELPEERTSVCRSVENGMTCTGMETTERVSISTADNGLSRVTWGATEALSIQSMLTFGLLRATRFGDIALTPAADPRLIVPCTLGQLSLLSGANGRAACNGIGAGMGYIVAASTMGPGLCDQVAPPPDLPRTADYVHVFYEEPELFTDVFGVETMPAPPTFQLTSN